MNMNNFLREMMPQVVENATATATNASPSHSGAANVIENILPLLGLRGFAPVYRFIGNWLGWDPTSLLTIVGVIWAANKLIRQMVFFFHGMITEHLMSTIHISSTDDIYTHLMSWLSRQPRMVNSRALMAETVSKTAWEDEDESTVARDRSGLYLNFSNQEARATPQYVPAVGLHNFWWRGQYFRLNRKKESVFEDGSHGGFTTFKDREDLMISCLWRSPEPIKQLLAHAKEHYYKDHQARTIVKRPNPQFMRRGRNNWQTVANRPVRDMKTVVLDQQQKLQVLADMNEYLHPATPRWYANRGIPLRRGYLFHGPPGTGKTSLSFALAGVFGLDIHVISLLEPSLTEEDLCSLFSSLPRRCVVLLEDIDTAGLRRPADELLAAEQAAKKDSAGSNNSNSANGANANGTTNTNSSKDDTAGRTTSNDIKELAKVLKKENEDQKKGISLSGLLNAIDGVASHEGRVLIMTTNVPESLDDALIRPGRVDLQVQFTYASKAQARELFIRMYEGDQGRPRHADTKPLANGAPVINGEASHPSSTSTSNSTSFTPTSSTSTAPSDTKDPQSSAGQESVLSPETSSAVRSGELDISIDELPEIARRFGDMIPDGEFSPAEIQGYLLKRKKHPRRAVDEADKWVAALVQQKASKTKISRVQ
ncbi:P-loop containing nucleoside triphosphate hydrolase protein [Nemania sp. FL0916]|nr:P-loop containing nucleoside triphosphate hydrolase protein [Nemania sp. FL0916]